MFILEKSKGGKEMQQVMEERKEMEKLVSDLSQLSTQSLMIIQSGASLLLARDQMEQKKEQLVQQ